MLAPLPLLRRTLLAALPLLLICACAHKETPLEKRVDAEVAQQQAVPPGEPMMEASKKVLFENSTLSEDKKQQLRDLYNKAVQEADSLRQQIDKNQLVLMKKLVDPKAKDAEVDVLKDRILKLEQQRAKEFLANLDAAKKILGRRNLEDERVYRAFLTSPLELDLMK
jgi:hypothetical protein